MPPVPLRVIHRVAIDPAEVTTKRTILWVMTSTVWNEIDPNLLDITARLADVLTRPDREALTAYLTAAEPAPIPAQDQIDVMSRAAHDLDTLALIAMAWPFTPWPPEPPMGTPSS